MRTPTRLSNLRSSRGRIRLLYTPPGKEGRLGRVKFISGTNHWFNVRANNRIDLTPNVMEVPMLGFEEERSHFAINYKKTDDGGTVLEIVLTCGPTGLSFTQEVRAAKKTFITLGPDGYYKQTPADRARPYGIEKRGTIRIREKPRMRPYYRPKAGAEAHEIIADSRVVA